MNSTTPYQYHVTVHRVLIDDAGVVTSYGIEIDTSDNRHVSTVADISTDRRKVEALCARFREGILAPEHLVDAVHDWLNAV